MTDMKMMEQFAGCETARQNCCVNRDYITMTYAVVAKVKFKVSVWTWELWG